MKRFKRANNGRLGGSGQEVWYSDLFRVVHWSRAGGTVKETAIESQNSTLDEVEIRFDGWVGFASDCQCIEQLNPSEILSVIRWAIIDATGKGRTSKAQEIRAALSTD